MPGFEIIIGCVGKPSAGKSTFFNAVTDGNAKVGNYPFTTIEPNTGVTYYLADCPCKKYGVSDKCRPAYGTCRDGQRHIPMKLLDVAGLIPGACNGLGLGNKFLDDLRQAHVLLHIIDSSGRTNEKGENCIGYDPTNDAKWLYEEIHMWIYNNIMKKWSGMCRKYNMLKSTEHPMSIEQLLQLQLSGYGTSPSQSKEVVSRLGIREPVNIDEWTDEYIHKVVNVFIDVRFPLILVLNKADQGGDTDKNIMKIINAYPEKGENIIVCSAAAECFLKKMNKHKYIKYERGDNMYIDRDTEIEDTGKSDLKPFDASMQGRMNKILDMVLFRYGSTGVFKAIDRAVTCISPIVVYPIVSFTSFKGVKDSHVFSSCYILKAGSTCEDLEHLLQNAELIPCMWLEAEDGRKLADDEPLVNGGVYKVVLRNA
ncbi:hypothetical protein WA158_005734 [Blastocystis sp. Blastoise]